LDIGALSRTQGRCPSCKEITEVPTVVLVMYNITGLERFWPELSDIGINFKKHFISSLFYPRRELILG